MLKYIDAKYHMIVVTTQRFEMRTKGIRETERDC